MYGGQDQQQHGDAFDQDMNFDSFDQSMDFNQQQANQQPVFPAPSFGNDAYDGFYETPAESTPSYNANFGAQPVPANIPTPAAPQPAFGGSIGAGEGGGGASFSSAGRFDDDLPLLEELGINFTDILMRTKAVTLPTRSLDPSLQADADLVGPLFFCLCLGVCMLGAGKLHFGYIYGFSFVGCFLMYLILNLMSECGISADKTSSILGYSLLPIVLLAAVNVFVDLTGMVGLVLAVLAIGWCTFSATRFVEVDLNMRKQRYLVAYPITLLYACFALLTIF